MAIESLRSTLRTDSRRWLVTGVSGFIGSHLLEELLLLGQAVTGLDNFSTGKRENLEDVRRAVGEDSWKRFHFIEGDIAELEACREACAGVQFVLHQAALGSVPRSVADPLATHRANIDGFVNMLVAARDAKVERFVFASSSSVYGDDPELPKREERIGNPCSPYAVTKRVNELYGANFAALYGLPAVGLRYFNVFGPRQDPFGTYAAVIPRWIGALLCGEECTLYGDGSTSRDFCYVSNIVAANLLAAVVPAAKLPRSALNVACGERTTLLELYGIVRAHAEELCRRKLPPIPQMAPERPGDVRHSLADLTLARSVLAYTPEIPVATGLRETTIWFHQHR